MLTVIMKFLANKKIFQLNQFKADFIWRSLQVLGKQGITFYIFILCAKFLAPFEFGVYNYLLTIIFLLALFSDFGISLASSKYVAEYNHKSKEKINAVIFGGITVIVAIGLLVTLITLLIGNYILEDKFKYVVFILPLIFLSPLSALYDGIYRGVGKFKSLAIITLASGLVSCIAVYFLVYSYGLFGALIAQNFFYFILLISLITGYGKIKINFDINIIKELCKYSLVIGSVSALYFLFTKINGLFFGYYQMFIELGYYELIIKFTLLFLLPFNIFAQVIGPKVVSYAQIIREFTFKNNAKLSLLMGALIFILINTLVIYLVKIFLNEYYVTDFINALHVYSLIVFTQGAVIIASNGYATYLGHASLNLKILVFLFPLNIFGASIIIPNYGFFSFVCYVTFVQIIADLIYLVLIKKRIYSIL